MSTTVYVITHDGEGERGRSVEVPGPCPSPARAARLGSEHFDDADDMADRISGENDHHDGTERVVVVEADGRPPERFRVRCRVVREYDAEPMEGSCQAP